MIVHLSIIVYLRLSSALEVEGSRVCPGGEGSMKSFMIGCMGAERDRRRKRRWIK
jgi:hypothetical protein